MGILSINSNVAALGAQRSLDRATSEIRSSFERLSSGQRINRASDDAAGLSVASSLNVGARVYSQSIRNANDGISLLTIAQGGTSQLMDVLIRLKELAIGAANGSLSISQRVSSDTEASELQKEFNRIVATTSFNQRSLLSGNFGDLGIQVGFGSNSINFGLGRQLERNIGLLTVQDSTAGSVASLDQDNAIGDFNGDGRDDLVVVNNGSASLKVLLSNGDGTFAVGATFTAANGACVGDFNGDGKLDIAASIGGGTYLLTGNGNGTFTQSALLGNSGGFEQTLRPGDLNGDGKLDLISITSNGRIVTRLGLGNGSFDPLVITLRSNNGEFEIADLNNDGFDDIAISTTSSTAGSIYFGSSSGSISLGGSFVTAGSAAPTIEIGDVNYDGLLDILSSGSITATILNRATAPGVFSSSTTTFSALSSGESRLVDFDSDGVLDIVNFSGSLNVMRGYGDGTFADPVVTAYDSMVGFGATMFGIGDFNADGVQDLWGGPSSFGAAVFIQDTTRATTLQRLNLTTRKQALSALGTIDSAIDRISREIGLIGSAQSRILAALGNLSGLALNYDSAKSRIVDADIASETARLTQKQILQQSASAVLAQANQIPNLALSLLKQ